MTTDLNAVSWLPGLLGPVELAANGGDALPARTILNFVGGSVTDDPDNDRINIAATAPATSGAIGLVQLAGDLAGVGSAAASPKVAGVTGDATGFAQLRAPVKETGNPKSTGYEIFLNLNNLAAATPTVIGTITPADGHIYTLKGIVRAQNSPASAYVAWDIDAFFRKSAGTATLHVANVTEKANSGGFVLTLTLASGLVVFTATDPLGARRWTGRLWLDDGVF